MAREVLYHAVIQKAVLKKRVLDRWSFSLVGFVVVEEEDLEVELVERSGLISADEESISKWLLRRTLVCFLLLELLACL